MHSISLKTQIIKNKDTPINQWNKVNLRPLHLYVFGYIYLLSVRVFEQ